LRCPTADSVRIADNFRIGPIPRVRLKLFTVLVGKTV
jgi:hypothetical protein